MRFEPLLCVRASEFTVHLSSCFFPDLSRSFANTAVRLLCNEKSSALFSRRSDRLAPERLSLVRELHNRGGFHSARRQNFTGADESGARGFQKRAAFAKPPRHHGRIELSSAAGEKREKFWYPQNGQKRYGFTRAAFIQFPA